MLDSFSNGPVIRAHSINMPLRAGETMHLSLLSDLHIDSSLCDLEGLRELMKHRSKLPNHGVICIGDVADLVMPPDLKRYRPSARSRNLDGKDDFLTAALQMVVEELKGLGVKFHLISPGNHEDVAMKFHGLDATSIIAHALGAKRGAYFGFLDYQIAMGNPRSKNRGHQKRFRVAWHHGAWGPGHLSKGYLGASRFFSVLEGYDLAIYGHNHGSRIDPELRIDVEQKTGKLKERTVYLVNCSSWTEAYSKDARYPSYKESKGYPPSGPRNSPLVRVTPHYCKTENSNGGIKMEVSIEV